MAAAVKAVAVPVGREIKTRIREGMIMAAVTRVVMGKRLPGMEVVMREATIMIMAMMEIVTVDMVVETTVATAKLVMVVTAAIGIMVVITTTVGTTHNRILRMGTRVGRRIAEL